MVRKYFIVFLVGLLTVSCAQVGIITGGDVDQFAPKPITEDVLPLNETANFTTNSVVIPFDEYFRLVNPLENIRIVPPHATIEASVKNKTLTLTWADTLESNTTYAIYLNNAIKDLNEGNDTIIQYVFSTGPILDTLSYTVVVLDAWSNLPNDECVVALFDLNSDRLVSLAKPSDGIAKLNYLRKGEYRAVAFQDENNDLKLQDYERLGFPDGGTISVQDNTFDSIPLRVFEPPLKKSGIKSISSVGPCLHLLTTHPKARDNNLKLYMDGENIPSTIMLWSSEDSVEINTGLIRESSAEFVLEMTVADSIIRDTLVYRVRPKDRGKKISIKKGSSTIKPSSRVEFNIDGVIESIDTSKIHLMNLIDSSQIAYSVAAFAWKTFELEFDRDGLENVRVKMDSGAVVTNCGSSKKFKQTLTLETESSFGSLNIDVSKYTEAIIIQLLKRDELVKEIKLENPQELVEFKELWPGEYTFKVIRDSNGNGKWDVGEYATLTQPEAVDNYSKKIKVRAGWTIDVPLIPKF